VATSNAANKVVPNPGGDRADGGRGIQDCSKLASQRPTPVAGPARAAERHTAAAALRDEARIAENRDIRTANI